MGLIKYLLAFNWRYAEEEYFSLSSAEAINLQLTWLNIMSFLISLLYMETDEIVLNFSDIINCTKSGFIPTKVYGVQLPECWAVGAAGWALWGEAKAAPCWKQLVPAKAISPKKLSKRRGFVAIALQEKTVILHQKNIQFLKYIFCIYINCYCNISWHIIIIDV